MNRTVPALSTSRMGMPKIGDCGSVFAAGLVTSFAPITNATSAVAHSELIVSCGGHQLGRMTIQTSTQIVQTSSIRLKDEPGSDTYKHENYSCRNKSANKKSERHGNKQCNERDR